MGGGQVGYFWEATICWLLEAFLCLWNLLYDRIAQAEWKFIFIINIHKIIHFNSDCSGDIIYKIGFPKKGQSARHVWKGMDCDIPMVLRNILVLSRTIELVPTASSIKTGPTINNKLTWISTKLKNLRSTSL